MQLKVVFALAAQALGALALAGCAKNGLMAAKSGVDGTLAYQNYAAHDYRTASTGSGNCAVFAASYAAAARRQGIAGHVETCLLQNGTGHAYFVADNGEVLDIRQRGIGSRGAVGCLPHSVRVVEGIALR